ncbi:unnamed protein product [Adineta steineri]|uniref:F-box domain-containing protein n=1 Tax=Adineta steineri TaxID=433720 RepID=A0A814WXC6_9BILA|nr:unnamed protein product [Adineta steineri]CAF3743591.1 unnamed protein product [Adineta steineri]
MNRSNVYLLDLPNEILFNILKKLQNVDVLYSLLGINNDRLDNIARNAMFSNILNFISNVQNTIINDFQLNRFCDYILPEISHNVKYLIVESTYIERILLATHYPNLIHLKIFNFQCDYSLQYFTDDSSLRQIFKQQIKKLDLVNKDSEGGLRLSSDYTKKVYAHILTYFENLEHLNIIQTSSFGYPSLRLSRLPSNTFSSMILTYLSIRVTDYTDCLYLLDGRLKQLNTFIVQICCMNMDSSIVYNMNDLPNLTCFSLISYTLIEENENRIVSLLHRMSNLEKLTLYLRFVSRNKFIDSKSFINNLSPYMTRVYSLKFYFSIENNRNDTLDYSFNINIQSQETSNIVCYSVKTVTYHVFTLPFEFIKLVSIGNIFPNIVFNNVIELWIHDIIPFQHEFFLRITQSFPLLQHLFVTDLTSLSYKRKKSPNNIQADQIVKYPHLILLDIKGLNNDCIEQFLNETKTYLPCLTILRVSYEQLQITTEDFTREVTRKNCANVRRLITEREIVSSKNYHHYFPLL